MNQETSSPAIAFIIAGYCLAVISFLLIPIIFMSLAIVCGLICFGYGKIGHGFYIIIFAIILGCLGAAMGGWGLGLPRL